LKTISHQKQLRRDLLAAVESQGGSIENILSQSEMTLGGLRFAALALDIRLGEQRREIGREKFIEFF
jgi:hypothetical protein